MVQNPEIMSAPWSNKTNWRFALSKFLCLLPCLIAGTFIEQWHISVIYYPKGEKVDRICFQQPKICWQKHGVSSNACKSGRSTFIIPSVVWLVEDGYQNVLPVQFYLNLVSLNHCIGSHYSALWTNFITKWSYGWVYNSNWGVEFKVELQEEFSQPTEHESPRGNLQRLCANFVFRLWIG